MSHVAAIVEKEDLILHLKKSVIYRKVINGEDVLAAIKKW